MEPGSGSMVVGAQAMSSSRVWAVASARVIPSISGVRAWRESRVPAQSGQVLSARNRLTRARRFSVSARRSSSVTVRRALRKVKSRSWTPFLVRSEEHTSELQSRGHLVCRLLLEKKKTQTRKKSIFSEHQDRVYHRDVGELT